MSDRRPTFDHMPKNLRPEPKPAPTQAPKPATPPKPSE
jgi:hypothetical protein